METIEAIIDKSQEAFGADHDLVSVDTNDRPVYKFGDANRKQVLSWVEVKVQTWHICMPRKRKECLYCCLASHLLHCEL